jgi:NAD(P)-dependent dehydrogenase (short-subunit alcohol dehydrogenase family)
VNILKMNSDHLRRNAMTNSKDVVVTGVSTGIGWGTTKVLVSKGFHVFGSVRKQADADRLQREFGNGFVPLMMDITDADAVHQAAQKVGCLGGGGFADQVRRVHASEQEKKSRVLVELGAHAVERRGHVLAQLRPVRTGTIN